MEELRCIGCGSILQSENEKHPGYVPKNKLTDASEDIICRRCFRLKHYNEVLPIEISQEGFYETISFIGKTNSLVVMIIDLFDIEGSLIPQIQKLTNHNDLLVLANKRDLLPKNVSDTKLLHHLRRILRENNVKPLDILLISATKYRNIDQALDIIMDHSKHRDIYIVGATNVGKSTFINTLLKSYAGSNNDIITVSEHMGTTLDFIKIPMDDNDIIDTPGIYNEKQIGHYLLPSSIKVITPKKEIKAKVYQLNSQQTLFINGFARVDFVSGEKTSFICYFGEHILIHRTKLEHADELYRNRRYDVLLYPTDKEEFGLKGHNLRIPKGKHDIVLPGLGFITIKGPIQVIVHTHINSVPYIREALI